MTQQEFQDRARELMIAWLEMGEENFRNGCHAHPHNLGSAVELRNRNMVIELYPGRVTVRIRSSVKTNYIIVSIDYYSGVGSCDREVPEFGDELYADLMFQCLKQHKGKRVLKTLRDKIVEDWDRLIGTTFRPISIEELHTVYGYDN